MSDTPRASDWVTVAEFAAKIGISRSQAYTLIASGVIPSCRLSARVVRLHWPTAEQAMFARQQGGGNGGLKGSRR
jgi:predicted DNA-binding transcriptional regulator AlpA